MRQKVLLQASASADKENAGTLPYSSASTAQEEPPSGNMVVTYASFTTMGDVITDTITGEAVQLEEFPPPLGLVPLPEVRLLEDARSAVVLPQTKQSEMSCIVQFYVYAPVGGSGRRSMATLTFVDVTAFRAPLSRELQHLIHTVQAVAGTAPEGSGDANFKNARLTTLLEPALQGYVTLVSITTISGRPEMYDATKAALQFTQDLGAIHQVLILIHIQNPRWFMESAQGIEALRTVREKARLESYSRGVYDYYKTASKWLLENVDNVDTQLERILEETDTVRRGIASEVSGQYRELQARVEEEDKELQEEVRCANTIEQRCEELTARLHEMETSMVRLEQQASQGDVSCGRKISEIQVELSGLESANSTLIEERRRLEKESTIYAQKVDELQGMLNAYAEDLHYLQGMTTSATELHRMNRKRARLEDDLQLAAQVVQKKNGNPRPDRQRQSLLTRLTTVQQRVEQLRTSTQGNSRANSNPKRNYRSFSSDVSPSSYRMQKYKDEKS
ncbi:hypothetical protein AGDE_12428 [Angomonas deanei]|nr:hypothetical protein AGDE_12428 [Angomonas deanei]|eukprot:EPY24277.1 hypothetical protein AGDE_12428 [Angomonas deanei]